jgi:VWFA-related protein
MVNIPLERAERPLFASKPIEPDVRNNMQGADGRIYVIMLDDLHSAALRSQRVKLAAKQFIEKFVGANDLAAVVHTSGRSNASQEFTSSQTRLLRAVDLFMGRKLTSSTLNRIDDVQRRAGTPAAGDPAADIDDKERGFNARNTLESIRNVAQYLGNIRGRRKAIVLFGEGIDYDINELFNDQITEAQTVIDSTRDMIAAATRANVAIYAVDPRGLGAEFDELRRSRPSRTTPRSASACRRSSTR